MILAASTTKNQTPPGRSQPRTIVTGELHLHGIEYRDDLDGPRSIVTGRVGEHSFRLTVSPGAMSTYGRFRAAGLRRGLMMRCAHVDRQTSAANKATAWHWLVSKVGGWPVTEVDFFQRMYRADGPLPGRIVMSSYAPDKLAVWCDNALHAGTMVAKWRGNRNAYYGFGLQGGKQAHPTARGGADTVVAIPSLYSDVDYGDKQNGKRYPATAEAVVGLLNEMPFPPSWLIDSGAGLHTYWCLKELWDFAGDDERTRAARISTGWQRLLQQKAKAGGFDFDSTFDLARVLRPIGSVNHNYVPARPVTEFAYWPGRLYTPDDFAAYDVPEFDPAELNGFLPGEYLIPAAPVPTKELGDAFEACLANSIEGGFFRDVWERRRKISDGSASVYTFALGCYLFRAGATSQQIVTALMTWRYRYDSLDKKPASSGWWESELKRIPAKAEKEPPITVKPSIQPIKLTDRHHLEIISERSTPSGKLSLVPRFVDGGEPPAVVRLEITSSASGQKDAVRKLRKYLGDDSVDVERMIDSVLTQSQDRINQSAINSEGDKNPTVREIVERIIPPMVDLRYCTRDGRAWSEKSGRAISRQEFICKYNRSLIALCADGRDAPLNDATADVDEGRLLKLIETALKILWATLMESLPAHSADAADLKADSEDARQFRATIVRLWTKPALLKNVPLATGRDAETGQVRASLGSLVAEEFDLYLKGAKRIGEREYWRDIRTAVSAWWRPADDGAGTLLPLLAMRHDLFDHIGIRFDGVTDQASLRRLGCRYSVFSDSPGVPDRMTGGGRLVVLMDGMRQEILTKPANETDEPNLSDQESTSDTESSVTEEESAEVMA